MAALLFAILIDLSIDELRTTATLRSDIVTLEQRMDLEPGSVEAGGILTLRANVLTIIAAVCDLFPSYPVCGARGDRVAQSQNEGLLSPNDPNKSLPHPRI